MVQVTLFSKTTIITMKLTIFLTSLIIIISSNSFAAFTSESGGGSGSSSQNNTVDFTESSSGAGVSLGKRFNIASDIISDVFFEDEKIVKDHIFSEIELFGNYNFSGEISQDYGARFNLGYEIEGFRIYPSVGYLKAKFDYVEDSSQKQTVSASSPFVGLGIGYDITKNVGVRVNYSLYSIDFKPNDSSYDNIEIDVSTVNLNLAVHF